MSRFDEPPPTWGHSSAVVDGELYVYGGATEHIFRRYEELPIYTFNQFTETWLTRLSAGKIPFGLLYGACTSLDHYIYHYGGSHSGSDGKIWMCDTLHRLDTNLLEWSQLLSGPTKKDGSSIISFQDQLAVFGGYGLPKELGVKFAKDERFRAGGWTNELHLFDLKEGIYSGH